MRILITGAGSGIGRGLALGLAKSGHSMLLADLNLTAAQETAALIHASGGSAESVQLNVATEVPAQPNIDVLINNAGLQHVAALEDFPPEKFSQLIEVMLIGSARMVRAVLPGMRAQGFGRIVNIGSIHALVASKYKSAYVAAKHGLLGLSKVIALETADTDITINTLCPSYVRTPLVEQQIKAQALAHGISEADVIDQIMLKPMPKGAFISIEELVGTTEFLLSPAARNITGQTITLDGGWTVQ